MKKVLSILLVSIFLLISFIPSFAASPEAVSPLYLNTSQASVAITISEDGTVSIAVKCIGKSSATSITATTYLERKAGPSWAIVDLGTSQDTWTEYVSARYLVKTYTKRLSITGEYRATTIFTVNGASGTETFTLHDTRTYQ